MQLWSVCETSLPVNTASSYGLYSYGLYSHGIYIVMAQFSYGRFARRPLPVNTASSFASGGHVAGAKNKMLREGLGEKAFFDEELYRAIIYRATTI